MNITSKKTVKCKDCGYLALVHIDKPPPFYVAPDPFPSKEVELPRRQATFPMHTYWPIRCHLDKADLNEELKGSHMNPITGLSELESPFKWSAIISRNRVCDGFTPYMQGLSPDEHKAEERRRLEKRNDRRHELRIIVLTTLITAGLLTLGEVLVKVFFN